MAPDDGVTHLVMTAHACPDGRPPVPSAMNSATLILSAVPGLPLVTPGDDLAALILDAMDAAGMMLERGDVLVVAQKIVSKAEGRIVALDSVTVSAKARDLAAVVEKDARLVELILSESRRVVRASRNLLIVEHRLGFVMANAGIDQSNVALPAGSPCALLLPLDPDASADSLAAAIAKRAGVRPAIVINDSFGRPWRLGTVGVALGASGLPSFVDLRGQPDLHGRVLQASAVAVADEVAAAASLLMGQAAEARPVILMRGLAWSAPPVPASAILRPPEEDQFR